MTDFSKLLNPEQCAAATAGEGPLLVLAAAGTGKTRTLVHRVAYLIEQGVPPERILLLTFTNRAAREMLERAEKVVGDAAQSIWSGTFHSICARFLRRYGRALGYEPGFQIIDEDDQKKLVNDIIKTTVKDPKDFPKKEIVLKMISEAANESKPIRFIASRWQTRAAGFTPEEIAFAETATGPAESLQRETGEDGFTLEHILTDIYGEERMLEHVSLRYAIEQLPEKERKTLYLRYFHGMTQEAASRVLGVSQVQVSRLERRAVERLREVLTDT